jgi:acyl-CoA thioester hydrolase
MFKLEMQVRDYECDLQGIVNNAVYLNYLEHARHEYLKTLGINFSEYTKKGINLVVIRNEIDYKNSLYPEDIFEVSVNISRFSRLKLLVEQEIRRIKDNKMIIKSKTFIAIVDKKGKILLPDSISKIFELKKD